MLTCSSRLDSFISCTLCCIILGAFSTAACKSQASPDLDNNQNRKKIAIINQVQTGVRNQTGNDDQTNTGDQNAGDDNQTNTGDQNAGDDNQINTGDQNAGDDDQINTGNQNAGDNNQTNTGDQNAGDNNQINTRNQNAGDDDQINTRNQNAGDDDQINTGNQNAGGGQTNIENKSDAEDHGEVDGRKQNLQPQEENKTNVVVETYADLTKKMNEKFDEFNTAINSLTTEGIIEGIEWKLGDKKESDANDRRTVANLFKDSLISTVQTIKNRSINDVLNPLKTRDNIINEGFVHTFTEASKKNMGNVQPCISRVLQDCFKSMLATDTINKFTYERWLNNYCMYRANNGLTATLKPIDDALTEYLNALSEACTKKVGSPDAGNSDRDLSIDAFFAKHPS